MIYWQDTPSMLIKITTSTLVTSNHSNLLKRNKEGGFIISYESLLNLRQGRLVIQVQEPRDDPTREQTCDFGCSVCDDVVEVVKKRLSYLVIRLFSSPLQDLRLFNKPSSVLQKSTKDKVWFIESFQIKKSITKGDQWSFLQGPVYFKRCNVVKSL